MKCAAPAVAQQLPCTDMLHGKAVGWVHLTQAATTSGSSRPPVFSPHPPTHPPTHPTTHPPTHPPTHPSSPHRPASPGGLRQPQRHLGQWRRREPPGAAAQRPHPPTGQGRGAPGRHHHTAGAPGARRRHSHHQQQQQRGAGITPRWWPGSSTWPRHTRAGDHCLLPGPPQRRQQPQQRRGFPWA
jgi:hypothetical protein